MAWDLKGATTEERFFAPRPGAQKPCGGKSRAASLRMTMCGGGFMSDLKVRPPEARNARLRLAWRTEARRYVPANAKSRSLGFARDDNLGERRGTLACGSLAGLKPARYFFCCAA